MNDEWTWEDRQDTLDYKQWLAESQWEDHLIRQTEGLAKLQESEAPAFVPGVKVTWIYWPPDARYRMAVNVEAEVVRLTNKKVVIKCWDRRGKEHIRHVDAGKLLEGYRPHNSYANGHYPVNGDAPQYKQANEVQR